jgi:hypothetical protein
MPQQLTLFAPIMSSSSPLIGLTIKLGRANDRCCDDIAVIGSSKGNHHASLTCAGCGRHRGWLPAQAIPFIKVRDLFGVSAESIVLRTIIPAKENTPMAKDARQSRDYDNTNSGALFKNDRKEGDRDPDYTGNVNIDGTEYWLSGWINTSRAGEKYMALRVRPKDAGNGKARDKAAQADTFGIG